MVTHADLAAWAGRGNVHRATRQTVAKWGIPAETKHTLTGGGIPITEQIITHVPYQSELSPQLVASDGRPFQPRCPAGHRRGPPHRVDRRSPVHQRFGRAVALVMPTALVAHDPGDTT
ncbi:SUKH-4 family immunity protein [Streptomyces hokutonensis]|uniref:SUKH-4 family immunity protein n=1 Tax=Streptomyces hokutonensis TaxID=1306990 RepID=UPI00340FC246